MFSISFFRRSGLDWSRIAASLLDLGQARVGRIGSIDDLNDHLRRDLGLPPADLVPRGYRAPCR